MAVPCGYHAVVAAGPAGLPARAAAPGDQGWSSHARGAAALALSEPAAPQALHSAAVIYRVSSRGSSASDAHRRRARPAGWRRAGDESWSGLESGAGRDRRRELVGTGDGLETD